MKMLLNSNDKLLLISQFWEALYLDGGTLWRKCVPLVISTGGDLCQRTSYAHPPLFTWLVPSVQAIYPWVSAPLTTVEMPFWPSASWNLQLSLYFAWALCHLLTLHIQHPCPMSLKKVRGLGEWLKRETDGPTQRAKSSPEDSECHSWLEKAKSSSTERV